MRGTCKLISEEKAVPETYSVEKAFYLGQKGKGEGGGKTVTFLGNMQSRGCKKENGGVTLFLE